MNPLRLYAEDMKVTMTLTGTTSPAAISIGCLDRLEKETVLNLTYQSCNNGCRSSCKAKIHWQVNFEVFQPLETTAVVDEYSLCSMRITLDRECGVH